MKKVLVMCLAVVMAFILMPTTTHAAPESVTITVTADKATLNPGDTVNFDVKLGAVTDLGGLDFNVLIPEGLSINTDSITMQDGLKDILKSDGDIVKPSEKNSLRWCYTVGNESYTGTSELCILSFSCTVNADAAFEEKVVTLQMRQCFDSSLDMVDFPVNLVPATLTVEKVRIYVSDVSLNQTSLTLKDGDTTKLTAEVTPANADNRNVSWSSDNTAVATVTADGTVTAVKEGTAHITVTTEDGGKTASCAVVVNCNHTMTKTDAVAPTCELDGNVEYWTCSKCGKKYADDAGTRELANVVEKALGHTADTWNSDETNHWKKCNVCGEEFDKSAHTFKWVVDKAATEDETGLGHEECVCGVTRSENTVISKLDHVHTGIVHHEAVAATCTTKGNVEYWTCSSVKCEGKHYGDAACQIEIAEIEIPVNPNHHVYKDASDSDCDLCGYKRFYLVTGGANASYEIGAEKGLTITTDAKKDLFKDVEIDGKNVDKKNYDVNEGSVVLKAAYLDTLSKSTHTIRILYSDGKAATTRFTVKEKDSTSSNNNGNNNSNTSGTAVSQKQGEAVAPKTGEAGYAILWIGMTLSCVALAIGLLVCNRKKFHK